MVSRGVWNKNWRSTEGKKHCLPYDQFQACAKWDSCVYLGVISEEERNFCLFLFEEHRDRALKCPNTWFQFKGTPINCALNVCRQSPYRSKSDFWSKLSSIFTISPPNSFQRCRCLPVKYSLTQPFMPCCVNYRNVLEAFISGLDRRQPRSLFSSWWSLCV